MIQKLMNNTVAGYAAPNKRQSMVSGKQYLTLLVASIMNSHAVASDTIELPNTIVTANMLTPEMGKFATGASVITQADIQQSSDSTLGDVLRYTTGVSSDTFGQGATRPIIRGQTAPRVKVIQHGLTVHDASQISPDHQVSVDVSSAKQLEVIKGSSALMYGGGATGGVVNVVDDLIVPQRPKKALQGQVSAVARQATNGYKAHSKLQAAFGNVVAKANFSKADQGNYRVPHWDTKKIPTSWHIQNNYGLGLSYLLAGGHLGFGYQNLGSEYGLPGHSHNSCVPDATHANKLNCGGHHHHHHHEHGEPPYVDLKSHVYRFSFSKKQPFDFIDKISLKSSYTDYQHHESDEGKVSTSFKNDAWSSRFDAKHVPFASMSGYFTGIFGISHNSSEFSALGAEKFIPKTKSQEFGLYLVERYAPTVSLANSQASLLAEKNKHTHQHSAGIADKAKSSIQNHKSTPDWYVEFGLRQDFAAVKNTENGLKRDFSATSASIEASKTLLKNQQVSARLSHSVRVPTAQELYAQGSHVATNTYERGDTSLKPEKTNTLELSYRTTSDDFDVNAAVFYSQSSDYIYAKTADMNNEGVRLIDYTQANAKSYGAEVKARYYVNDVISIGGFADTALLEIQEDGKWANAPRVPASRLGGDIQADYAQWQAKLSGYHRFAQSRTANFETKTPSYNMLNAKLTYRSPANYQLFLEGTNLLNELAYNHASYLVEKTPQAKRSVNAGISYQF